MHQILMTMSHSGPTGPCGVVGKEALHNCAQQSSEHDWTILEVTTGVLTHVWGMVRAAINTPCKTRAIGDDQEDWWRRGRQHASVGTCERPALASSCGVGCGPGPRQHPSVVQGSVGPGTVARWPLLRSRMSVRSAGSIEQHKHRGGDAARLLLKDPGGPGGCSEPWPAPADPPTHPPTSETFSSGKK